MKNSTTPYKICIVGGGTAGWMAASYLKSVYANLVDIAVVYDHDTPNIGVGESTTPAILMFLDQIGITYQDLIKDIGSTIKLGIKFENWSTDNECYWHPFNQLGFDVNVTDSNVLAAYETANDIDENAECYSPLFMSSGKVPVTSTLTTTGNFAMHIDADKFGKFLKEQFKNNISVVNDKVVNINITDKGVESIDLQSGNKMFADLFVDASGLSGILINKISTAWEEPTLFPLMNRTIPIQIHKKPDLSQTYTLAEAHGYGWLWKIPLQDRSGIGYNYNSNYISDDDAIEDFKKILKEKNIEYSGDFRTLKYTPGYQKTPWNKNVLSIGLSSGFIEPLEATAIHIICNQLLHFVRHNMFTDDEYSKKIYNKKMENMYRQTFEFVELHYYTNRSDTSFWTATQKLRSLNIVELLKKAAGSYVTAADILVESDRIQGAMVFGVTGYTRIMSGLNLLNTEGAKHFLKVSELDLLGKSVYTKAASQKSELFNISISAEALYERIKNG